MKYSNDKDMNREIRALVRKGWQFKMGRKHGRLISPAGGNICVPSTPSDRRALCNLRGHVARNERGNRSSLGV